MIISPYLKTLETHLKQMTPGNLILVDIYLEATKQPFSYLFINLSQECHPDVKYLSNLFNGIQTYIPMGKTFRKIRGNGNFKSIIFGESHQALEVFKQPSHKNNACVIEPNE